MNLSLCLIVKNEEKTLGHCLKSFSSLAKEIVVVDTGSEDRTKVIARQFEAKIFDFKWVNDFSLARNFCLSKATQEWVMMVDADDIIEENSLEFLSKELSVLENKIDIISLPYVYQKSGKNNKNTGYLPRIWNRSLNLIWKYPVHEYLDLSPVPHHRIKRMNLPIIHQKKEFKAGFKRNMVILESYLEKHPTDLRMLYYAVHDSYQLGDWDSVIYWSQKYIEANPQDSVEIGRTLVRKGNCHLKKNQMEAAQEAFLLANGVNALLIEPYLALGDLYKEQERYEEAIHMYECARLCKVPKQTNAFYNPSLYHYSPLKKLAYVLPFVGEKQKAIEYAEKALNYSPQDRHLRDHLQKLKYELKEAS